MKNEYLRHTLATINYRFQKSIRKADNNFSDFNLGKGSRSSGEIIIHMFQVLNSTRFFIEDNWLEKNAPEKLSLSREIERFNAELKAIDSILAEKEIGIDYSKRMLQGPLSDILTHIGQIAMLRRLYDEPIEREDFSAAHIKTGLI